MLSKSHARDDDGRNNELIQSLKGTTTIGLFIHGSCTGLHGDWTHQILQTRDIWWIILTSILLKKTMGIL